MRRLTQAFGLMLVCTTLAIGGTSSAITDVQWFFLLDYVQVRDYLKGGKGLVKELEAITEGDSAVLAKFWMQRAFDHCHAVHRPGEHAYTVVEETETCRHGYFFDHWDEINQMIRARYEALKTRGTR